MGPPSYMWSVVDRNVAMRRMTVSSVTILTEVLPLCILELIGRTKV